MLEAHGKIAAVHVRGKPIVYAGTTTKVADATVSTVKVLRHAKQNEARRIFNGVGGRRASQTN